MMDTLLSRRATRVRCLTAIGIVLSALLPSQIAFAQAPGKEEAGSEAEEGEAASAAAPAESAPTSADEAAAAEAEMEAELEAGDEQFTRAPAKGKGAVWGVVRDTKFNEGVIDAQVQVVGRKEKAFADVDGRFRIELPPGKYSIRVSFELHQSSRVDQVEVKAGKVSRIDFKLVPDETSVEEVVIEDEVDRTSNEGQALERKRSAVVGDGVGRAEIARTPDRNAAEAAQRVVGATIVGGRFVYVRGLGERYTNALLNGAPLPSPEPDRNTVPLDLFPSLVLDSLTITKQFTPDMPGDFAGGSVRINTRDFPRQTLFQISLSGGYNTLTTFRERQSSYGSRNDWLGFDGGRREFPTALPNRRLDQAGTTAEERVDYGYHINTPMGTLGKISPPNFGVSVVAGDSYKLNPTAKLGSMLALTYGQSFQLRDLTARRYKIDTLPDGSETLLVGDEFEGEQGIATVRWGLFGSLALELEKRHTLKLLGLRSQSADDLTSEMEGSYETSPGQRYHVNHLEYVSRALNFVQLRGEHRYPKLNDLEIDWHASISTADRDQPDTRDVRYQATERDGVAGWLYTQDLSGEHSWLAQSDTTWTGGLDVTQPLIKDPDHETRIKVGTLIVSRDREFLARRFRLATAREPGAIYDAVSFCPGAVWDQACPGFLFRQDLVRPDGLGLEEWTLRFDQYETGLDVYSLYGMLDTEPHKDLRVVAGVRAEITYQTFAGFDPFDRAGTELRSRIYQTDYLPAASVIYAVSPKANARLGASQTVARPQLREISPALFTSYSGDLSVAGNPSLEITKITNLDLRFEVFPTLKEVLAASVFYKRFAKPIEEIIGGTGQLGFANADKADLVGVELEGRKSLGVLASALSDFTAIANLTLVYSKVDLGDQKANATNASRPLSYQSPYVINLALDYGNDKSGTDVRLLYNVYGPRITVVGAYKLPDTYELPRHQVDASASQKFTKHFEIKLQAQNVLSAPVVFAYRNRPAYRKETTADGGEIYHSLGRQPITRRYNPGATFTLSATYSY